MDAVDALPRIGRILQTRPHAYRCRYDYGDDVERVRCTTTGRLIAFRSLP